MKFETLTGEVIGTNVIRLEGREIICWTNRMEEAVSPRPLDLSRHIGKKVAVSGILHGDLYLANVLTPKDIINRIVALYSDATVHEILNDLVAIGTWPTPERPKDQQQQNIERNSSVSIDTVPLSDRPSTLKKLLSWLITACDDKKLGGTDIGILQ